MGLRYQISLSFTHLINTSFNSKNWKFAWKSFLKPFWLTRELLTCTNQMTLTLTLQKLHENKLEKADWIQRTVRLILVTKAILWVAQGSLKRNPFLFVELYSHLNYIT